MLRSLCDDHQDLSPVELTLRIIQGDGIATQRERDPPGQNCAYIPPGDHRKEDYRIGTYAKYPESSPVLPVALAKMGFYYTGYRDRVKCFSCGMSVDEWVIGDDVTLPRWHRHDCLMMTNEGGDPNNVPSDSDYLTVTLGNSGNRSTLGFRDVLSGIREVNISTNRQQSGRQRGFNFANIHDVEHERLLKSLNLKYEENRRKTFEKWPSYPAPRLPRALAENGFFYLGNLDRTQCYFCAGVLRNWAAGDSVIELHRRHFPSCKLLSDASGSGNISMTEQARRAADEADNERFRRQGILTDEDPIIEPPDPSPEELRRLAQIYPLDNPMNPHMAALNQRIQSFNSGWPYRTRATPEQISAAGFYFLGESDKTKCYYCNGGLQNWDRNDEPWTEHAKWFPGCAFVIRHKGQDFVRRLYELHPNLNRPFIRNPVSYEINVGDIPPATSVPVSVTSLIESATGMGFPSEMVQRLIQRKMDQEGNGYTALQDLVDDLLIESSNSQENNNSQESNNSQQLNTSYRSAPHEPMETSSSETNNPRSNEGPMSSFTPTDIQGAAGGTKRTNQQLKTSSTTDVKKTRTQSPSTSGEELATAEMRESLRVMQESSICKCCNQNKIDVVCIPCGHLALCSQCSPKVKKCPVCNTKIQETMKIFRA